ncbi:MAG: hypothetical protein ACRDGJ_01430 [Candidatus Limnocylindria bacterium]
MPRQPGRMRRLLLSLTVGLSLVAVPGVASADPAVQLTEHFVFFNCDFTDAQVNVSASFSSRFGSGAFVAVPPGLFGESFDGVSVVDTADGGATMDAVVPLFDSEGNSPGNAVVSAVLTPTGVEITVDPNRFREGNRWINTVGGLVREMAVTGGLTLPDATVFDLSTGNCFGQIGDIQVFETQPHTFVANNTGMFIDCHWDTGTSFANLFAFSDPTFGPFADTFLEVPGEHLLFVNGPPTVTMSTAGITAFFPLFDAVTMLEESATVTATFALSAPVTSEFLAQNFRQVVTEQRITPTGTLSFSTSPDHEFVLDGEVCFGSVFDSRFIATAPAGPKPGAATAVNDTSDGATALSLGKVINDQTRNTAVDPEIQVDACPQPDDRFGHTLWYSFTGTGGPVTIDTAGSNFDTVIAVYDDGLNQLACNDDVEFEPIGGTFQAALTLEDTVEGATYLIQAGGFDGSLFFLGVPNPEFGRLRIKISG